MWKGTVKIDFEKEPIGVGKNGREVYLKDIWPSHDDIAHGTVFISERRHYI